MAPRMHAMESVVLVLAMLLAVVASGYLVRVLRWPVPLPLVQIAMGAVIAGVFKKGIVLDPEVFFLLFLPPLLFLDGWRIPNFGLLRDKGTILELALGLVLFTVVGVGFLIHWIIPAMPCRWPSRWPPSSRPPMPWPCPRSRRARRCRDGSCTSCRGNRC